MNAPTREPDLAALYVQIQEIAERLASFLVARGGCDEHGNVHDEEISSAIAGAMKEIDAASVPGIQSVLAREIRAEIAWLLIWR